MEYDFHANVLTFPVCSRCRGTKYESMRRANEEGLIGRRIDVGTVNSYRNSSRKKSEPYVVQFLTEFARRALGMQQQEQQQQQQQHTGGDGGDVVDGTASEKVPIILPDSYTKKGIYREFIFQQGYVVCEHRGGPRMKDYTLRSDQEWNGKSPGPICSIACFTAIWQKDCSHIHVNNQQAARKELERDEAAAAGARGFSNDETDPHQDQDENGVDNDSTKGDADPPKKKSKILLSDRSGNPYTALREAHELLLEENQQLRERSKDEKESFQEEIQHLKERVHFLEMQIRTTRANRPTV